MIGKRIVLVLPDDDEPVRTDHRTTFRSGDEGFIVAIHPRWNAYIVAINGVTAVFFPDEIQECA